MGDPEIEHTSLAQDNAELETILGSNYHEKPMEIIVNHIKVINVELTRDRYEVQLNLAGSIDLIDGENLEGEDHSKDSECSISDDQDETLETTAPSGTSSKDMMSQKRKDSKEGRTSQKSKGKYRCTYCMKQFRWSSALGRHLRTHTNEKPFMCAVCGKTFSDNSNLVSHSKIHTGEKPYRCTYCTKAFLRPSHLNSHLSIHDKELPSMCLPQSEISKLEAKEELGNRILSTDSAEAKESPVVRKVVRIAKRKRAAKVAKDPKVHSCSYCGKIFGLLSHLSRHIRIHTNEKPFACTHCDKKFSDRSNLSSHIKVHTGYKPFKCAHCERAFPRRNRLIFHLRSHMKKVRSMSSGNSEAITVKQVTILSAKLARSGEEVAGIEELPKAPKFERILAVQENRELIGSEYKEKVYDTEVPGTNETQSSSTLQIQKEALHETELAEVQGEPKSSASLERDVHVSAEKSLVNVGNTAVENKTSSTENEPYYAIGIPMDDIQNMPQGAELQNEELITMHGDENEKDVSTRSGEDKPTSVRSLFKRMEVLVTDLLEQRRENEDTREQVGNERSENIRAQDSTPGEEGLEVFDSVEAGKEPITRDEFEKVESNACDEKANKICTCSYCGKIFRWSCALERHLRTHTKEKPYACTYCDKAFSDKSNLTSHLRYHEGKPYKCRFCEKTFNVPCRLKRHLRTRHPLDIPVAEVQSSNTCVGTQDNQETVNGDLADVQNQSESLPSGFVKILPKGQPVDPIIVQTKSTPERRESTGKSYKCPVCDREFKWASGLSRHRKIHTNEKPYVCAVCGKAFTDGSNYKSHTKIHFGEKRFKCPHCEKAFWRTSRLNTHLQTHAKRKAFYESLDEAALRQQLLGKKTECNSISTRLDILEGATSNDGKLCTSDVLGSDGVTSVNNSNTVEMKNISGSKGSNTIGSSVPNSDKVIHRQTELTREGNINDEIEGTKESVGEDESFHHSVTVSIRLFQDRVTKRTRSTNKGEKVNLCSYCGKVFPWSSGLTRHMRIHTNEKPYRCNHCDKSFSDSSNLKSHLRVHDGVRPFKCYLCDKGFPRSNALATHLRTHAAPKRLAARRRSRKPETVRKVVREVPNVESSISEIKVEKSESTDSGSQETEALSSAEQEKEEDLEGNQDVMTAETEDEKEESKLHTCEICSKTFSRSRYLVRHLRTHTNEKAYECEQGSGTLTERSNLTSPVKVRSRVKSYKCTQCEKAFSRSHQLNRHLWTHLK